MTATNATFISYRRSKGSMWALALYQRLTMPPDPVDVFYDIEELKAGPFDHELLEQIAARPYFLLVLTPGTLKRCRDADDWLRREIEHAVATRRIIVPIMTPGFNLRDAHRYLPGPVGDVVAASNGVELNHTFFSAGVDTLKHKLLTPTDRVTTPQPDNLDKARAAELTARDAPTVTAAALRRTSRQQSWQRRVVLTLGALVVLAAVALLGGVLLRSSNDSDGGASGTTAATTTPGRGARLGPGQTLGPGQHLDSQVGNHTLAMTEQGQLVALTDYQPWWRQEADGQPGAVAAMQDDGNLVVYGPGGAVLWATRTENHGGAYVVIEDDGGKGVLTVYDAGGTGVLWQKTQGTAEPATGATSAPTSAPTSSPTTDTTHVTVPCLVGLTEASARSTVGATLEVRKTTTALKAGDPKIGQVVSQSPACGTRVDRGSTVTISIGVAAPTTTGTAIATTTTS